MQYYIGVKSIKARQMSRQAYNDYRNWTLPSDEDGSDEGYLVEYLDGGQSNHPDHRGYISWSPAEVFKRAYRPVSGMTFGLAIEAMKKGYKVARKGWNGKDMFIFLADKIDFHTVADLSSFQASPVCVCDSRVMKTASGDFVVGWLASQTDMLAEDWMIISESDPNG